MSAPTDTLFDMDAAALIGVSSSAWLGHIIEMGEIVVMLMLGWWLGITTTKNRHVEAKKPGQKGDAVTPPIALGENANQSDRNQP